jgi:hypothetical protein
MNRKQWLVILSVALAAPLIAAPPTYRLRTQFTGGDKCVDIVNDGENNKLIMAPCGNFSGQFWKVEHLRGSGYSRLQTEFTGSGKCLDIINDGKNDKLQMARCGNFTGQHWTIEPSKIPGYSRLRTEFTGQGKCLDIVNDGRTISSRWRIAATSRDSSGSSPCREADLLVP